MAYTKGLSTIPTTLASRQTRVNLSISTFENERRSVPTYQETKSNLLAEIQEEIH